MTLTAKPALQHQTLMMLENIAKSWRAQSHEIACALHIGAHECSAQYFVQGDHKRVAMSLRALICETMWRESKAVIITHYHPAGTAAPSMADHRTTRQVAELLLAIEVSLIDHVIFANSGHYSFRRAGHLGSKSMQI